MYFTINYNYTKHVNKNTCKYKKKHNKTRYAGQKSLINSLLRFINVFKLPKISLL